MTIELPAEYLAWVDAWDGVGIEQPPKCGALWVPPASSVIGPLSCIWHADHSDAPAGDVRHAAPAGAGGLVRWSDADAKRWAEAAAAPWTCPECRVPCERSRWGGYCSSRCRWTGQEAS